MDSVREKIIEKLLGKEVRILLPDFEQFSKGYIPGTAPGCYDVKPWPRYADKALGMIDVNLRIENQDVTAEWLFDE